MASQSGPELGPAQPQLVNSIFQIITEGCIYIPKSLGVQINQTGSRVNLQYDEANDEVQLNEQI